MYEDLALSANHGAERPDALRMDAMVDALGDDDADACADDGHTCVTSCHDHPLKNRNV